MKLDRIPIFALVPLVFGLCSCSTMRMGTEAQRLPANGTEDCGKIFSLLAGERKEAVDDYLGSLREKLLAGDQARLQDLFNIMYDGKLADGEIDLLTGILLDNSAGLELRQRIAEEWNEHFSRRVGSLTPVEERQKQALEILATRQSEVLAKVQVRPKNRISESERIADLQHNLEELITYSLKSSDVRIRILAAKRLVALEKPRASDVIAVLNDPVSQVRAVALHLIDLAPEQAAFADHFEFNYSERYRLKGLWFFIRDQDWRSMAEEDLSDFMELVRRDKIPALDIEPSERSRPPKPVRPEWLARLESRLHAGMERALRGGDAEAARLAAYVLDRDFVKRPDLHPLAIRLLLDPTLPFYTRLSFYWTLFRFYANDLGDLRLASPEVQQAMHRFEEERKALPENVDKALKGEEELAQMYVDRAVLDALQSGSSERAALAIQVLEYRLPEYSSFGRIFWQISRLADPALRLRGWAAFGIPSDVGESFHQARVTDRGIDGAILDISWYVYEIHQRDEARLRQEVARDLGSP